MTPAIEYEDGEGECGLDARDSQPTYKQEDDLLEESRERDREKKCAFCPNKATQTIPISDDADEPQLVEYEENICDECFEKAEAMREPKSPYDQLAIKEEMSKEGGKDEF